MDLDISQDLVQSPDHKAAGTSETTLEGLLSKPLKLHEDLTGGCGGQLWPAGVVLAKYLLRKPRATFHGLSMFVCFQEALDNAKKELIKCRSLELGAGSGLVGLALAKADYQTSNIYITDQDPMLALMQRNIALNNLVGRVSASVLNWGEAIPSDIPRRPDIVLAADCVYFEPAFPLLQQTLKELIGEDTVCYFCFKKRRRADLHFMKEVRKMFDVTEVEDDRDEAVYSRENIFLCVASFLN